MDILTLAPLAELGLPLPVAIGLVVTLGLGIGILSAAFGIGGGFLITPFCHSVLAMPASLAVATSMGQIPLMSASGTWRYYRAQVIRLRPALWLLVGAVPAAQLVAGLLAANAQRGNTAAADWIVTISFTVLIGGMGVYNLHRAARHDTGGKDTRGRRPPPAPLIVGFGLIFGAISALLGIGGGFFAVPFFVYLCGLSPAQAVATSLFCVMLTGLATTARWLWLQHIHFGVSLLIATGSIVGAQIGSRLALSAAPAALLRALGTMQVLVCAGYLVTRLTH